ncbi:hypothetical protein AQUCO_00200404v1 [Aquilegia coerulea]|uniref:Uncharacterized protein n=1 Tax=Aquilegia coerulea TaxID=218851 RepID=A0A2G5F328_AQUCA|nr:hypothetical protein AQUCO_00200404v1 [Aquilegia coerulea]
MVAISLYRGNLHRVPDIPRRWLMPNHTISLKDFKSLTRKRDKTLSRLLSTTTITTTTTTAIATTSNPNPDCNADQQQKQHEFVGDNGNSKQKFIEPSSQPQTQTTNQGGVDEIKIERERDPSALQQHRILGDAKDCSGGSDGEIQRKGIRDSILCPDNKSSVPLPAQPEIGGNGDGGGGGGGGGAALEAEKEEKQLTLAGPPVEISNDVDPSDREKKKKDLEENLKVLNERKHNLVQMLKQRKKLREGTACKLQSPVLLFLSKWKLQLTWGRILNKLVGWVQKLILVVIWKENQKMLLIPIHLVVRFTGYAAHLLLHLLHQENVHIAHFNTLRFLNPVNQVWVSVVILSPHLPCLQVLHLVRHALLLQGIKAILQACLHYPCLESIAPRPLLPQQHQEVLRFLEMHV